MGKILNYKMLGTAFKSLSDACFKADEQQRKGEKVTACGMSDDDLDRLCDIIPNMLNPMMSTEEVKEKHQLLSFVVYSLQTNGCSWRIHSTEQSSMIR